MNQENKKKLAFMLAMIVLIVSVMFPIKNETGNVEAAEAKAKLGNKSENFTFYNDHKNYVKIRVENMKKDAKYSVSVSDETIAQFVAYTEFAFTFWVKKPKDFKVTIKETYKGKVRKVGTETVLVEKYEKERDDSDGNYAIQYYDQLIMEQDTKIPLDEIVFLEGDVEKDFGNEEIVSVEDNKFIQANNVGTTDWHFTYEREILDEDGSRIQKQEHTSIKFIVEEQDKGKEMQENRKMAEQINQYCITKVTKENANELLRKICIVDAKVRNRYTDFIDTLGNCRGEFDEESGEYKEINIGQVMIPTIYHWEDLYRVKTQCELKSTIHQVDNSNGISLEALKITKLTPNKVTLQLAKAPDSTEVAFLEGEKYQIILKDKKFQEYHFKADLKQGRKTITGKLTEGSSLKVGQTYYATVSNKKDKTVKNIKAKCIK